MGNKGWSTKVLAQAGVLLAMAQVLSYIKIYQMPQGGSVTLASMAPLIIFALLHGFKKGTVVAVIYGVLQMILGGLFAIHPLSLLLDYVVGFGVIGIAGIFKDVKFGAVWGTIAACFGRFMASFLSGFLVFASYAPKGMNPVWYSLIYNGNYMIPETIVTTIVVVLVFPVLRKYTGEN